MPSPKTYEIYTLFLKCNLIKRKYQTVNPINAEGQNDNGAKAVDAISPARAAYMKFILNPIKSTHYAINTGAKTKFIF